MSPSNPSDKIEFTRLLVNDYNVEFEVSTLGWFQGPKEVFLSLQQYTEAPYYESPLATRAEVAMHLAASTVPNTSELFRVAFARQPGPIPLAAVHHVSSTGETLLHAVANAIGVIITGGSSGYARDYRADLPGNTTK